MACEFWLQKDIKLGTKPLQTKGKHIQATDCESCPQKNSEKGIWKENEKIKVKGNGKILDTDWTNNERKKNCAGKGDLNNLSCVLCAVCKALNFFCNDDGIRYQ